MLSRLRIQIVLSLIVVSFLVPTALLFYPSSTQADTVTCAARAASAIGLSVGSEAAAATLAVPTNDIGNKASFTISSTSNFGEFFGQCVLKPIAIRLGNAMLANLTHSIVNWINTGFKGNPMFIQNLNSYLSDATDQAIGQFIQYDLGAGFLCQPFAFQVRLAIAQSYLPYHERATCTLTQVTNNVNGFIEGDNSGGWDNWLQVTTVPQNNVYGATILAQDELSKKLINLKDVQDKELSWSHGFIGKKICTVSNDPEIDPSIIPPEDKDCAETEIETPGATVENYLAATVSSDIRRLEVAQDLDAIIGALANQLTSQVINGATGLLGAGRSSNGGYRPTTYQNVLNGDINDPALSTAIDQGVTQTITQSGLDAIFSTSIGTNTPATAPVVSDNGDETGVQPDAVDWFLSRITPVVNNSTAFGYDLNLESNYSARNIMVRTTLRKNGVAIPFRTAFLTFQITYGRDGVSATKYIESGTDSSAAWSNISADPQSNFLFKFAGTKATNAPTGQYIIETIATDASGTNLAVETDTFEIQ